MSAVLVYCEWTLNQDDDDDNDDDDTVGIQVNKIREGSPEGTRVTMEERICERDEF